MTLEELKAELASILVLEEETPTDWRDIEARCVRVLDRLNSEVEPSYPHDVVYHFLEDADGRQKSARYARGQRERLWEWLSAR